MWAEKSVFYQIYPLGFCGAPEENDGVTVPRIKKVGEWIPHICGLGATAVYFSPVFQSDRHGYDTRDYFTLDCRLGSNADFAALCGELHQNGLRVVLDGVFNHVGRGFWAFRDVQEKREASAYRDWFTIRFDGNSNFNDGFWYEGWEGHYELVKLNLKNPAVREHIFAAIRAWVEQFDIDGLRLDVAYCLDKDFLAELRRFCDGLKSDFWLMGETLFGDYNQLVNDRMLHSCTNYECYKGLHSSFNEGNLFELSYSLNRQFGRENWTIYKGKHLVCFGDNHDVTRLATILKDPGHLPLCYAMLFTMPGVPCIYYGSEWGAVGDKKQGDAVLRPSFAEPQENDLTQWIAKLSHLRAETPALVDGDFANLVVQNRQWVFERRLGEQWVVAAVNAEGQPCILYPKLGVHTLRSLLTGKAAPAAAGIALDGCGFDCFLVQ